MYNKLDLIYETCNLWNSRLLQFGIAGLQLCS